MRLMLTITPTRLELFIDGHTVYSDYRREGDTLYLTHVEAPPELRGTGAAGKLMQAIMEMAQAQKLKLAPICSYAVAWLRKHEEYHSLLK